MTKQFSELTQENLQTQEAHAKAGQPIGEYQKQQEHLKSNYRLDGLLPKEEKLSLKVDFATITWKPEDNIFKCQEKIAVN